MNIELEKQKIDQESVKLVRTSISVIIFSLITGIAWLWTIVEFLIYLAKDDNPFNWWSLF